MTDRVKRFAPQLTLVAVIWVTFGILEPRYRDVANVFPLLEGMSLLGLISLGLGLTVIAGEFDLSVAAVAATSGILAVQLADEGLIMALLLPPALAVGFGALQGFIIGRFEISSLLVTLASLIAVGGLARVLSNEKTALLSPRDLSISDTFAVRWGYLTPLSLAAITLFIAVAVVLGWTRYGTELRAIGGARAESVASGVSSTRILVGVFAFSSFTAAVAGTMIALRAGAASPSGYEDTLLTAVAAVLVGGVALTGGQGSVLHIVLGCLILRLMSMGIGVLGQPSYVNNLATGALLLIVLVLAAVLRDRSKSEQTSGTRFYAPRRGATAHAG